jgi:hypothetical protein
MIKTFGNLLLELLSEKQIWKMDYDFLKLSAQIW